MAEVKSTAVAEKKETFSVMLTNSLTEVEDALPKDFNKTRFVQNAVALLNENDVLAKFAKEHTNGAVQIKSGLLKGAFLGLDFYSNEAYLIPYGSKLQFMPSYRGCVKLAQKYSIRPVKDIYAKVVRAGDKFEEKIVDGQPTIDFLPLPFNDAEIIGAFAVCQFQDGGMQYDVMTLKDLENTRKASKMANGPAWKQYTSEMYKKVVIHRLTKHLQIDFDNAEQYRYFNEDNQADFGSQEPKGASMNAVLLDEESEVVSEQ